MKVITTFYAIILGDRSSAPGISRNRFATMSDHACTVQKRVYRTTNAPVSTTRTPSLPQDPVTRRTRANILRAIRLTSQWIRLVAIIPYVCIRVSAFVKYYYISSFSVLSERMKTKNHLRQVFIVEWYGGVIHVTTVSRSMTLSHVTMFHQAFV